MMRTIIACGAGSGDLFNNAAARGSKCAAWAKRCATGGGELAGGSLLVPYLLEYRGPTLLALLCLVAAKLASVACPLCSNILSMIWMRPTASMD